MGKSYFSYGASSQLIALSRSPNTVFRQTNKLLIRRINLSCFLGNPKIFAARRTKKGTVVGPLRHHKFQDALCTANFRERHFEFVFFKENVGVHGGGAKNRVPKHI